jgi:hypothetical protein
MRLIDADALDYELGTSDRDIYVRECLAEAPSVTPEPHWIPVTERLPEASGLYLVSVKNDHERRYSKTAWFEKDVWFARQDVIAWMPLPEPYKGVTE